MAGVKTLKTRRKKSDPPAREKKLAPLALQDSLGKWFEENPCKGPGDLRVEVTVDALRRAEQRTFWLVNGYKLSRIEVMELLVDMVAERHPLLLLLGVAGMPKAATVARWQADYPAFQKAMEMAERMRATLIADEAVVILDNTTPKKAYQDNNRAGIRMKLAAALDSRKFGKKLITDPIDLGSVADADVWSRFRSILIVHAKMIEENTGVRIDVPVEDAEIISVHKEEPRTLDVQEIGMQGGMGGEDAPV